MVTIGSSIRIKVPVGDDSVEFICRRPTAEEQSKFLRDRFETKGRKVKSHLYETRVALIDRIATDIAGAQYENAAGETVPLNAQTVLSEEDKRKWAGILGVPVKDWRDLVPASWKSSAAMRFEDAQPEDEGGEGN